MKFRLFIIKDPDAKDRGYSLKGIKIPLTTFCPVHSHSGLMSYDESSVHGRYVEYWKVPTSLLVMARPNLSRHLKRIDYLMVPTEWCDVAPVDHWEQIGWKF